MRMLKLRTLLISRLQEIDQELCEAKENKKSWKIEMLENEKIHVEKGLKRANNFLGLG